MQGRRKIGDKIHRGEDPSGRAYYWIGAIKTDDALVPGTDFAAVAAGHISVTPIDLEMTDLPSMDRLRGILD
jgi:5'-nucleotidase